MCTQSTNTYAYQGKKKDCEITGVLYTHYTLYRRLTYKIITVRILNYFKIYR